MLELSQSIIQKLRTVKMSGIQIRKIEFSGSIMQGYDQQNLKHKQDIYKIYKIINNRMFGLKNLVNRHSISQESLSALQKKSEQYKKIISAFLSHLQAINRVYEDYYATYEKNLIELLGELKNNEEGVPQFCHEFACLFRNLNNQLRILIESQSGSHRQLVALNVQIFAEYSGLVQLLQIRIKEYCQKQQNLLQFGKKYFRVFKTMTNSMEQYKNSFMDVKLIYNNGQKIKRYFGCVNTYRQVSQQLRAVQAKLSEANDSKSDLSQIYLSLSSFFANSLIKIAGRFLQELRTYFVNFSLMQNHMMTMLTERKLALEKHQFKTILRLRTNRKNQAHYSCQADEGKFIDIPSLFLHHKDLKQQFLPLFNKQMVNYMQEICETAEKRKNSNKKTLQFINKYLKNIDKNLSQPFKELILNFQKLRKALTRLFGFKWVELYKLISSLFENYLQINSKFKQKIEVRQKNLQASINMQNSLLDLFSKQLKALVEKSVSKRFIRKLASEKQIVKKPPGDKQIPLAEEQQKHSRQQISHKAQAVVNLIQSFVERMNKSSEGLKSGYNGLVAQIRSATGQLMGLCGQFERKYFAQQQYSKAIRDYEGDIRKCVDCETQFFTELSLGTLLKQNSKISFDSQFSKIQEFKKIKKPAQIAQNQVKLDDQFKQKEAVPQRSCNSLLQEDQASEKPRQISALTSISPLLPLKMLKKQSMELFLGDGNASRHAEFIAKKIVFGEDQKYVKSFACGLNDKIILTGRLFITTNRICFFSKLNSRTVFFGETFIQVPKCHIKKIEKRINAIVFDNSLSITTINGQMFFTSFFQRNQAYELLCKTFDINPEEEYFVEQAQKQPRFVQEEQVIAAQEDDISSEESANRIEKIARNIPQFNFVLVHESQMAFPGLNAMKYFKLFDGDQEATIGRKTYASFTHYFKDLNAHKDITVSNWLSNPLDYFNSINIKAEMPQKFSKTLYAIIPLPSSNIPFMPKTTQTNEDHHLHFFSKDKYVIEAVIQNSGVPYSDTFDLRMQKTVESTQENKCKLRVQFFINFNQSTIMKSTIQSKTYEQSRNSMGNYAGEIRKYLKNLEKRLQLLSKKASSQEVNGSGDLQGMAQLKQQIEENQKQIDYLKQTNQSCSAKISQLQSRSRLQLYAMAALGILSLVLMLALFSQ